MEIRHKKQYTEALIRSWLHNRIEVFMPRIKKLKPTKAAPYTFTLEELTTDMQRTLNELQDRIGKKEI